MVGEQLGAEPLKHKALEGFRDRISVMEVEVGLVQPLFAVSIYCWVGEGLGEKNRQLLGALVELLLSLNGLWVVGGDFNMEPSTLAEAGVLDAIRGTIAAPEGATCSASVAGTVFDYFLLPEILEGNVENVFLAEGAPTSPHTPSCLTLTGLEATTTISKVIRPKSFPTQRPIGCMQAPKPFQWSWQTGSPPEKGFKRGFCEWTTAAEAELCRVYQISGDQAKLHLGRAKGFATKQVSLMTQFKKDSREFLSPEGHCWAGLASLVSRARCAKQDLIRSNGDKAKARRLHKLADAAFAFTGACQTDADGSRMLRFSVSGKTFDEATRRVALAPAVPHPSSAGVLLGCWPSSGARCVTRPCAAESVLEGPIADTSGGERTQAPDGERERAPDGERERAPTNPNQQQHQQHSSYCVFVDTPTFATVTPSYLVKTATSIGSTATLSYLREAAEIGNSNSQQLATNGSSQTQLDTANFTREPSDGRQQQAASSRQPTDSSSQATAAAAGSSSSSSMQPRNSSSHQSLIDTAAFTREPLDGSRQATGNSSSSSRQEQGSSSVSQSIDTASFTRGPGDGSRQATGNGSSNSMQEHGSNGSSSASQSLGLPLNSVNSRQATNNASSSSKQEHGSDRSSSTNETESARQILASPPADRGDKPTAPLALKIEMEQQQSTSTALAFDWPQILADNVAQEILDVDKADGPIRGGFAGGPPRHEDAELQGVEPETHRKRPTQKKLQAARARVKKQVEQAVQKDLAAQALRIRIDALARAHSADSGPSLSRWGGDHLPPPEFEATTLRGSPQGRVSGEQTATSKGQEGSRRCRGASLSGYGVIWCRRCGAYCTSSLETRARPTAILLPCNGRSAGEGLACQKRRALAGFHPAHGAELGADRLLAPAVRLSPWQILKLETWKDEVAPEPAVASKHTWAQELSRDEVLRGFGLTESTLAALGKNLVDNERLADEEAAFDEF